MALIHILIAFIIALVSGLGVGGGGLFATYLAMFTDISQLSVQGFNLLFFLFCAGASVAVILFRRRINFFAVGIMVTFGLVGALLGSFLTLALPAQLLRRAFGIMLVSTGIVSLKSALRADYSKKRSTRKPTDKEKATDGAKKDNEKGSFGDG